MFPFANIQKTYGAQGELVIKLRADARVKISTSEPVFIIIDGLPVPFYFKSFMQKGNNRAVAVFDDVESQQLAEELVGDVIWLPCGKQATKQASSGTRQLDGYKVYDSKYGNIGTVCGFWDIPDNPCLQLNRQEQELLIPYHEAFILKINHRQHIIETQIPEGLLDI